MEPGDGRRVKVLIVEDDENIRRMFEEGLERVGYEVVVAADGEEGVMTALREMPDVILMNYMMGRMDGLSATRRLLEYPHMRRTPIILNSGCDMYSEALECGCVGFISIPCSMKEVVRMVERYSPGGRAGF